MTATHSEIRKHFGHGEGTRKVAIHRDGTIEMYGSTEHTDRSRDYWVYVGTLTEVRREIDGEP